MMEKPLTYMGAAAYLDLSMDGLVRLIESGEIVPFLLNGQKLIAVDELDRFVRDQKTDAAGRRQIREV